MFALLFVIGAVLAGGGGVAIGYGLSEDSMKLGYVGIVLFGAGIVMMTIASQRDVLLG